MNIFWSWQSDTHQPTGRYFVRDVLNELAAELNGFDAIDEAERPGSGGDDDGEADLAGHDDEKVFVDHDMKGIAGHAPIAETILTKIEAAAVFVADLTPIASTKAGKLVPNPNVMIELGYALRALGHHRLVLIANQGEKAKLDKLPFDLKHWSAPVMYKLASDAGEERIRDEAARLKAALRPRIEATLKVAAREIRDARRVTHRQPELAITFDDDMELPIELTQRLRDGAVRTLEEIKAETPLRRLPPKNTSRASVVAVPRSSDVLRMFAPPRPPEQWSREETEGYNGMVSSYYRRYETYLDEDAEYRRLVLRSFQVKLLLENSGTSPATNIDAVLSFPSSIILHDFGEFPEGPTAPEPPPLRPLAPGQGWVTPVPQSIDIPRLITPYRFRTTHIYPDRHQVRFDLKDLKHHERAIIDAFIVSFAAPKDIGDFDMDYVITANEPLEPIRGTLRFLVSLDEPAPAQPSN